MSKVIAKKDAAATVTTVAPKFTKAQKDAIYALAVNLTNAVKSTSEPGKAHAKNTENGNYATDLIRNKLSTPAKTEKQHTSDKLVSEAMNASTAPTEEQIKELVKAVAVKAALLKRATKEPNISLAKNYVAMSMVRIANGF